ncbi:MAG: potassium transporter [Deltaproteobacteria bacterium]|nr:potassium transporter [Deltaproteobacteria bacterium]
MKTVWILGAGQFGEIAAVRLRLKYSEAAIIVVDQDPGALRSVEAVATAAVVGDGAVYLAEHLTASAGPDWIVPAIPVHLAFEWLRIRLSGAYRLEKLAVPETVTRKLGCVVSGHSGSVYTSLADFICPGNCPEPADLCFVTGKPRPIDLYAELSAAASCGMTPVIIRSRQLSAGVGGYRPGDLFDALRKVEACQGPVLLGTACRCHSVLDAFRLIPRTV